MGFPWLRTPNVIMIPLSSLPKPPRVRLLLSPRVRLSTVLRIDIWNRSGRGDEHVKSTWRYKPPKLIFANNG
jgi:hypothetical protein